MDKEVEKTQGEKYASKRDKVAEEVQTVRYTLRKFLELIRKNFEADSCYLYQVNTEMDEDEKKECIRKRVEHIKNVYEKRGEIYPNELENAKNNPNRVKILNFVDISEKEDKKVWSHDSYNKPEKYVVFDKCTNNYKGTIGDGLKATIEADKIYFDAVDSVTSNESRSDINISIFEEGLNGYIARTKKTVIFSSDKAISRHSSSASYNVKKGITFRCEMMIGFPLIDEDKSVIGILKIEKYIMNYDMGEDNYKFDKLKIDQGIEDVKKYLPLFVKFIKSSKEEFDTNSYEKLLRGIELLEDLKRIEPIILKDVLIRLLKSLDDFFRTNSCEKLCTTMELLGSLDQLNMEVLKKTEIVDLGLSEELQNIKLDFAENSAGATNSKEFCQEFKKLVIALKSLDDEKNKQLSDCKRELSNLYLNIDSSENSNESQRFEKIDAKAHDLLKRMKQIENCKRISKEIKELLKRSNVNYSEKDYEKLLASLEELDKENKDYLVKIISGTAPKILYSPERTKCPKEIKTEICRLLEYLKRIENYERIRKNIKNYLLENKNVEYSKPRIIQSLKDDFEENELNYIKKRQLYLEKIEKKVEYQRNIYSDIKIIDEINGLNEKLKYLVDDPEKSEQEVKDYLEKNSSKLKEINEKLEKIQEEANEYAKFYNDIVNEIDEFLDQLNKKVINLKEIICELEAKTDEEDEEDHSKIKKNFNPIIILVTELKELIELEKPEVTSKVLCDLVQKLQKKEQYSKLHTKDFFENINKLDKLAKKENEYKNKEEDLLEKLKPDRYNKEFDGQIHTLLKVLYDQITNLENVDHVLANTKKEAEFSSEIYDEIGTLLGELNISETLKIIKQISEKKKQPDNQDILPYCERDQSCDDINVKESLKTKFQILEGIKTTLENTVKICEYSNQIIKKINLINPRVIKKNVEYRGNIYANIRILDNINALNEKLKYLVDDPEKSEQEVKDYLEKNSSKLKEINEKLEKIQEEANEYAKFYNDIVNEIDEFLDQLNKKVINLKEIICELEAKTDEEDEEDHSKIKKNVNSKLPKELNELMELENKVLCDLVPKLQEKKKCSERNDDDFWETIKKLEESVKKENEYKDKENDLFEKLKQYIFDEEKLKQYIFDEEYYNLVFNLSRILDSQITNLKNITQVLSDTKKEAKLSCGIYEEIYILLGKLKLSDILEITHSNNLKETLKAKYELSNKIKTTLEENTKEINEVLKRTGEIDDGGETYDDLDTIRKLVQKQKIFQHKLPTNPMKIKCYELFCEETSRILENLKRFKKHRNITDEIIQVLENFELGTDSSEHSVEIYKKLENLSYDEIDYLLKYLRTIRPIILENIKDIKDKVKIVRDICDVNSSEKIHWPVCPEQINKKIYDLTLNLFFDFKRKERIGYDEISNEISMYMNQISKLLNLDADMTRSYKDILEGARKHEELLLCGLDDYRDHFVHQFHVFISGYIIINELGFDVFVPKMKKNREYVLGKQKDSYELSKSDILRIWFLTASYHDYAYILEKIEVELESFFKEFLGYSFKIEFDWKSLLTTNTEFTNYLINFVKFFDSEIGTKQDVIRRQDILRRNYLDSIITKHDHGVLSALLLTNYTEGLKEKRYYEYMCAALAISLHNEPMFKNFTEKNKIWFESFPIAFLLAYCDTAQTFGRLEGKEHVESSKYPIKFSGIRVEKNKNKSMQKPRIVYKLEYLCEQLNKNPTEDKIKIWAKNVNNVFQSGDCHFEIEYYKKGGKDLICTLPFY